MKSSAMVICVAIYSLSTWAHGTEIPKKLDRGIVLERPGDPPAPASVIDALTEDKTTARIIRNGHLSVQVNVNPNGHNTGGDAANEPSIAVDPTAPNRMVIGWRQFDSISSNHREAGVAWSNDGGRTWNNPGSLNDGIFRSDPVLACDADGHFFYNSLSVPGGLIQAEFFDSGDGGQTWSGPADAFGGDKVWVTIDRTNGIGRGNIYQTWSTASNQWGERVFSRSTDGGRIFSDPQALIPPPIWGTLTVGRQGELFMAGNAGFAYNVFVVWRSLDAKDPDVDEPSFVFFFAPLGGRQGVGDGTPASPNPAGLLGQVW
ncbi:MAG: sialidase family protein, partial [Acidobacteriota bacterium]